MILTVVLLAGLTALPAVAERPRPLGWALEALRTGDWEVAAKLATRDGQVAMDVIEWLRLRAGRGTYADVAAFLARRTDWPGEAYLRKQSEEAVIAAGDGAILGFFTALPPQTPEGALAHAGALLRAGKTGDAEAGLVLAWLTMPMSGETHAKFLAAHGKVLNKHHAARLDAMLWAGERGNAERLFDLVPQADVAVAKARIGLAKLDKGVDSLIAAVPASHIDTPGLHYERFNWRARKGRAEDAKALMLERSTSAAALGRPAEWANRRRSLARDEMRDGSAVRAYELASRHFLTEGSDYADLEWLAGYIALVKLKEPETAVRHFNNHDAAVASPISKGRAGYWRGRALEALGRVAEADQAYTEGAQHQTSFYGLLAAERAGLPFDTDLAGEMPTGEWRSAGFVKNSVFEAGLLLQASGNLDLAERFWTHLAESLSDNDAGLLGQAALEAGGPHMAVMVGKRVAERGLVIPSAYYPLHPVTGLTLPMAPEMVLSIARRESEFDPTVQSGAGARGLMQIMPGTGRDVAARLGRSGAHSTDRLIADPDYNALLGATYLSGLAGRFHGNVVMMAAGYNAGPGRPDDWIQRFGDPRNGGMDMVDWIEHIPFRETQNYVMRVTESLPIYRARLGKEPMPVPFSEELAGSSLLAFAPKGE